MSDSLVLPKRLTRVAVVTAPALAVVATLAALTLAGDLQAGSVGDPSPAIRIALPLTQLLRDLAVSALLGVLAVAVWVVGPTDRAWNRLMDTAAAAAAVWTITASGAGLLTFVSATGLAFSDPGFGRELIGYVTDIALGRAWGLETAAAATLTALCVAMRSHTGAGLLVLLSAIALLPVTLQGHAGGAGDEAVVFPALFVHVLAAGTWTGGLAAVTVLAAGRPSQRTMLLGRFGTLAALCLAAVIVSGMASALLRLGSPAALLTPYGRLIVLKVVAWTAAAVLAGFIRARLTRHVARGDRPHGIALVIGTELIVLAGATGIAVAMARTPSPLSSTPAPPMTSAAAMLTGRPLPPPLTALQLLTSWRPDTIWIVLGLVLAIGYGVGVARVRHAGGHWSIVRVLAWCAGIGLLVLVTSSGVNRYEQVLVSVHVASKLLLLLVVPSLLRAGAPGRLIDSTVAGRTDDSRGLREWRATLSAAPVVRDLMRPVPAAALAISLLVVLYTTSALAWEARDVVGHEAVTAALLATGALLASGGRAPAHHRASLLILSGGLVGLAALMLFGEPIGAEWFFKLGWSDPGSDQRRAGFIVLAMLPVVLCADLGRSRPSSRHRPEPRAHSTAAGERTTSSGPG